MTMYTIYSKPACPQCDQSKMLLTSRSIPFKEIVIDIGQQKVDGKEYITPEDLKKLVPGAKTVPQVFKDSTYIGGYIELKRSL